MSGDNMICFFNDMFLLFVCFVLLDALSHVYSGKMGVSSIKFKYSTTKKPNLNQ